MLATRTLAEEILELKKDRRAILLAHHYQESEIQELADVIGDSLELSRKAREFVGDVIAFCGVWFMAETAKVLNPLRTVVVPDQEATCSLVESCPVEPISISCGPEVNSTVATLSPGPIGSSSSSHAADIATRAQTASATIPRTPKYSLAAVAYLFIGGVLSSSFLE